MYCLRLTASSTDDAVKKVGLVVVEMASLEVHSVNVQIISEGALNNQTLR